MEENKPTKISKDQNISDIIETFPETADYFMEVGIHCAGCMVADFESLEEGLLAHGFSEEEIDQFTNDLNEIIDDLEEQKTKTTSTETEKK